MCSHNSEYPDNFPEGCPPDDATSMEVKVYRMIKGDSIDNSDFKSYVEEGLTGKHPKYKYCEYGLSINSNYDELKKTMRSNSALKKKFKNIASGTIHKRTGVVKATPTGNQLHHHTWWIYKDINPERYFEIEVK